MLINKYDEELENLTQKIMENFKYNLQISLLKSHKDFFDCLDFYNRKLDEIRDFIRKNIKSFSYDFSNVNLDDDFTAEYSKGTGNIFDIHVPDWFNLYFPY